MSETKVKYPFKVVVEHTQKITYEDTYEFTEEKAKRDQKLIDCIKNDNYSDLVDLVLEDKKIMPNNSRKTDSETTHIRKKIIDADGNLILEED
ncbi:MAG: hypothetical protein K9M56_07985 [Victivallales bacterium]|nr:hypothetical protein [Victivallales bacterium]